MEREDLIIGGTKPLIFEVGCKPVLTFVLFCTIFGRTLLTVSFSPSTSFSADIDFDFSADFEVKPSVWASWE